MAELTKVGVPSLASLEPPQHLRLMVVAGETIAAGDACYIHTDGLAYKSNGAAATAPAKVRGFAFMAAVITEPVTLLHDVNLQYGSGMTPGVQFFLSDSVLGGLATVATTGGTAAVAYAVDATRIRVLESRY